MKKIVIIGNGGFSKTVINSLNKNIYEIVGLIDEQNLENPNYDVYQTIEELESEKEKVKYFFVAIGDNNVRKAKADQYIAKGMETITVIDKSAMIADSARIGDGVYVGVRAIINAGTTVQNFSIINTDALVEHSCFIGQFCNVAPRSLILGNVVVEDESFIGAGAEIKQTVRIARGSTIGMGSLLLRDIKVNGTVYYTAKSEVENVY